MSDSWLSFLDDFNDDGMDDLKKALESLANDLGEDSDILIQYGGKLKKYTGRLAENKMSGADFQTRVRDLARLTEMRILEKDVKESAQAQALLNKATDFILNKLVGAIL